MTEEEKVKESSLSGRCKRIHITRLTDKELEKCVNGLSEENFMGKFQFGEVYRGTYNGIEVVVKIWKKQGRYKVLPGENEGRLEDERCLHQYFRNYEFHPNVAKACAFCHGSKHLAVVYHTNPKAIDTLHNLIEKDTFTWAQRIKVAFGLASLLRYMHTPHPNCPSDLPYLIRNIDAAHILVDQDHEPLLFDFSMISGGILTDKRDLLDQHLQGCFAIPGPGRWSDRCDVFSYGVVLLSLISKRIYKDDGDCTDVPLVYELVKNENKQHNSAASFGKFKSSLMHRSLELEPDFHFNDAIEITQLALLCVECDPQKRPTMDQVVGYLQKMHIVQDNDNTWECCKMLDGVDEVPKLLYPPKYRRVKELWRPTKQRRNKGCGESLSIIKSSVVEDNEVRVFSHEELLDATSRFGKENLIGQFQFGNLFRGEERNGKKVIVKMWEINDERGVYGLHNEDRLRDEISLLRHPELFNHPNLVKMIGYCFDEEKHLGAVYDLDPQDTLHNLAPKDEFTWLQRMKVIYEFAKLLKYFHGPNPPHAPYRVGNVEAASIILDKDYRPKLFDFGMTVGGIILSLREERNAHLCGRPRGYGDRSRGIYIEEGDIFAYGWILVCLISKTSPTPDDDDPIYDALGWNDLEESSDDIEQSGSTLVHEDLIQERAPDDEDPIFDADLEESSDDIEQSGITLVHEDLIKERGFEENDGVELTKLGLECTRRFGYPPSMKEVVKRLENLHVIRIHAEEMGIQNLPCRYNNNTKFELVQQKVDG
ncbi:uncharacterized protein [Euphorbia lathyris]|uniref:uncharacterized protein n=1 Tax=Euphorbia lathyris TaxID=212925 RepID=UPI003313CA8A